MSGHEVHDTTSYYGQVVERWPAGPVELVRYATGEVRLRCVTTTWGSTVVVAALDISKHEVSWPDGDPPTVSPSILVHGDDTGNRVHLHGFVRAGVWEPCGDDRSVPLPEAAS